MTRTSVADVTGDWWSVALRGVAALLAGVVMVVSPIPHQSHLLPVFGAYMLTEGIVELVTAARAARAHQPWSKAAAQGILFPRFERTPSSQFHFLAEPVAARANPHTWPEF